VNDKTIITDQDELSPKEQLEMYTTHYFVTGFCANCDTSNPVKVKKGVKKYGLTITCRNCGCKVNL